MDNHKLSNDFLQKITAFSAGFLSPGILESFISLIEREIKNHFFTFSSESNLLRIISSMYDKRAFISDTIQYPHYAEILVSIASNSNYLTDILVRNPEYFYRIVNPSHLNKPFTSDECRELAAETINNYKTFNAKVNAIRGLKRREILRIGLKDILRISDVPNITLELSILAKELTALLFKLCYQETWLKNNLSKLNNKYCLISLGKLGGGELNYSSDIDLMIFYDKDSSYGKKTYREILTEAIYLFIEQASAITAGGYLYRIDFRLRPDGRNAPLCGTIKDYISYYESRGEDWERQMLIKADLLTGDPKLFKKFTDYLKPFIYPSSFKSSPIDQIRKMKLNIENALNDDQNIKLSGGGIRDIEFTVQALQLINGYKNEDLKTGNTLKALKALSAADLINTAEYETLSGAYIIYRKIEHFLQLMNDQQTHTIPETGEMAEKLSVFLGYKTIKEFRHQITSKRTAVRKIFNSLAGEEKKENILLDKIRFSNRTRGEKDLMYLREGKGLLGTREFDMQSIKAFQEIEPDLLEHLAHTVNPDLVLQNFVRIIRTAEFPSIWYNALKNKKLLKAFITICEFSLRSVDMFAEDSYMQELFITGAVFGQPRANISLRELHFILSVQLCLNIIDHAEFSSILSAHFQQKIKVFAADSLGKENYFIAGMGSFGTGEMGFASDIDLIFGVDQISSARDQQKVFLKLLSKLKEGFKPFETDCRLRPEGKTSQLVWDINSYINYISNRARIWELQAFTKMNFIAGNKTLFNKLTKSISKRLQELDCTAVKKEMSEMRKKLYPADYSGLTKIINIKKSAGGLTDIEFIIQYLILCNPELFLTCRGSNTTGALGILQDKFLAGDAETLKESFRFLRLTDLINQNIFNLNHHNVNPQEILLSESLGFDSPEKLSVEFNSITRKTHQLFKKYLGK